MADVAGTVGGVLGGLFTGGVITATLIGIGLLFLGVIGGLIYYFGIYRRKFNIIAKITSQRSGDNNNYFFDKAAILHDKKENTRYLRLLNTKVDIEIPKFNILTPTNWGDYVEILRRSERGFSFLLPPKVNKEVFISSDGKRYPFTKSKTIGIEQDLTFILNRERQNKNIINPESFLLKLLAYTPQIISMVISMMVIWIVFRYAPDLLNQFTRVAREAQQANAPTIVEGLFFALI